MRLLLASIVDVTIVLALALVAAAALKRRSAALRHVVLAAAIVCAALSPALELLVPQLPVIHWNDAAPAASPAVIATPAEAPAESGAIAAAAPETPAIPWTMLLVTAWMLGAMVTLAGLLTGLVRLARLTARCTTVRAGRWREMADELSRASALRRRVALLQSTDPSLLVTCGVLRPKILLPTGAESWTDDRRHIVLAHEMAHILRHDGAWQLAGEILRVIHWFNPLVWLSCRRLRQESEYACDDAVLSGGIDATAYATQLLGVARQGGRHHAWASAPAIADSSTLERRVSAMLNRQRNREPLTRRTRAVAVLAAVAVIVPLAAAGVAPPPDWPVSTLAGRSDVALAPPPAAPEPALPLAARGPGPAAQTAPAVTTQQAPPTIVLTVRDESAGAAPGVNLTITAAVTAQQAAAEIRGTVLDQSGGALPGVKVMLTATESGVASSTFSDGSGRFAFRSLQPARYELTTSLAGFTTVTNAIPLAAGATADRVIFLPLGTVETTINVDCAAAPAAAAARPAQTIAARTPLAEGDRPGSVRYTWIRMLQEILPVLSAQPQTPVRVGGQIRAPMLISQVRPACPTTLSSARESTLTLAGRIGVDGSMRQVTPVAAESGAGELIELARNAVRQWTFRPALLNGEPVEVNITIRVNYMRMQ